MEFTIIRTILAAIELPCGDGFNPTRFWGCVCVCFCNYIYTYIIGFTTLVYKICKRGSQRGDYLLETVCHVMSRHVTSRHAMYVMYAILGDIQSSILFGTVSDIYSGIPIESGIVMLNKRTLW